MREREKTNRAKASRKSLGWTQMSYDLFTARKKHSRKKLLQNETLKCQAAAVVTTTTTRAVAAAATAAILTKGKYLKWRKAIGVW